MDKLPELMDELKVAADRQPVPDAPGALRAPHRPGMTPDHSTIPGQVRMVTPKRPSRVLRPLAQYGSAQEIISVYGNTNREMTEKDWEQAPPSQEELRRGYPWQMAPAGPTPAFQLGQGTAAQAPGKKDAPEALPEETAEKA